MKANNHRVQINAPLHKNICSNQQFKILFVEKDTKYMLQSAVLDFTLWKTFTKIYKSCKICYFYKLYISIKNN